MAAGAVIAVAVGAFVATRGSNGGDASSRWVAPTLGNSQGLATDGEVVCSTTVGPTLYCADPETGETTFTVTVDPDDMTGSPELVDGTLLMGLDRRLGGNLLAYSLEGDELWSADVAVQSDDEMAVVGDTVVAVDGLMDSELVGVDLATGEERWRTLTAHEFEDPRLVMGGVHTDGRYVYVAVDLTDMSLPSDQTPTFIIAVDPASGAEVWRTQVDDNVAPVLDIGSVASLDDGTLMAFVVYGSHNGSSEMVVVDTATGQRRWQVPLSSVYASVAHIDGTTVLADGADTRGYSSDGTELWAVPSPEIARTPNLVSPGALVIDGDRLWSAGYDVYELDPTNGSSVLLADGVSAIDVAVVGERLVISGISQLEAIPIGDDSEPRG